MFQAALTTHNIDADSAMGISIITDDRSSWFSDDEEVSECVYVYHNATIVVQLRGSVKKRCVFISSKRSKVNKLQYSVAKFN